MRVHSSLILPALIALSTVRAEDCPKGLDPLDQWQTCTGRCHIYHTGEYGACGHQITSSDLDPGCGSSLSNACISTFNAGWSSLEETCDACYQVTITYPKGTRSVYLRTIDSSASDTKFEMSQFAWSQICPVVCAGTGVCAFEAADCQYGIIEDSGEIPGPCFAQSGPISYRRLQC